MFNNPNLGTFDDTFGENRGNDVLFLFDDVSPKEQQQEENVTMTAEKVRNELDLLGCETLDKDSIEKNLNRVIDWFKSNEAGQELLNELPDKLGALFGNMKDQLHELDFNATGQLKAALNRMADVNVLKDHLESFEREHGLDRKISARIKELDGKLKNNSKKIKKEKKKEDLRKKHEEYAAEKKNKNKLKITKRESSWQNDRPSLHKKKQ